MKSISLFATPKTALSANEMKQLKGGGNCSYMAPSKKTGSTGDAYGPSGLWCGITEEMATQLMQFNGGGEYCCNDCNTRSNRLATC